MAAAPAIHDGPRGTRAVAHDFFDPARFAASGYPYDAWRTLRREDPVAWVDGNAEFGPFWAITRHADVVRVSKDPATFSSARGQLIPARHLPGMRGRMRMPLPVTLRAAWSTGIVFRPGVMRVVVEAALAARRAEGYDGAIKTLLGMDPPEHGAFRRIAFRRFSPTGLRRLEAGVSAIARELVDRVIARAADPRRRGEAWDFVAEVAAEYPMAVICELLGFPRADFARIFAWSNAVVGALDPEVARGANPLRVIEEARLGLFDYFARHVASRRRRPAGDLVSELAAATVETPSGPRRLTDFELLSYCFLLTLAGNETTRNASSGGLLALIERPALWERLRREPEGLPGAIEEMLRWSAPIVYFARTATRDVELGGRTIRAGDRLALFYPSANRDEAVFPDPDVFDPVRDPNPHLSFGMGEHFCMGAHLARLELRILFGELLARAPRLAPAGPVERLRSHFVGGVKRLPVRFADAPAAG